MNEDVRSLLSRNPLQLDLGSAKDKICGSTIAVTGAAGSVGTELCRQILHCDPRVLLCIDQDESGIFYLQHTLANEECDAKTVFRVCDISDSDQMRVLFRKYIPTAIFHAAAYKHVPLMEQNVKTVVRNNVFGLLNLLDAVQDNNCGSFIFTSTDKAVNPTSIMGATKRIGELIVSSQTCIGARCISVRFGNVLFSRGSVVPILQEQIRSDEPLTITHPNANRYFITAQESASFVLQAFTIGNHGDTLVLDMGTPVKIVDLARTLIRLAGKTEQQIEIKFTGLREGEKLSEELFYSTEDVCATSFSKIKKASNRREQENLPALLEELRIAMYEDGTDAIREKIKQIVPEYQPPAPGVPVNIVPAEKSSVVGTEKWAGATGD